MHKKRVSVLLALMGVVVLSTGVVILNKDNIPVTVNSVNSNYKNLATDFSNHLLETIKPFSVDDLNNYISFDYDLASLQSSGVVDRLLALFKKTDFPVDVLVNYDVDAITQYLEMYNSTAIQSSDAYIIKDEIWKLVPEVQGSQIDIPALISDINSGEKSSLHLEDYLIKPDIYASDLQSTFDELDAYSNWKLTYSNGTIIESSPDYVNYENGQVVPNTDWILQATRNAIKSYNTVGSPRDFITNSGESIIISGGTWGSSPSLEKESAFITESFLNLDDIVDRVPIYTYSYEEFTNTYIELSIAKQHLWVYKDGALLMETDVVTGDSTKKRDTPTGCYFISECINGKYLTGADYKTWVNKWMRLTNTGIGLHDAKWQPSFGGSRYKGHGSHGCINLPPKFASDLFDTVSRGWLVVIY